MYALLLLLASKRVPYEQLAMGGCQASNPAIRANLSRNVATLPASSASTRQLYGNIGKPRTCMM
jgi:hypothetical protein